jgi:phage terminase large subunit GpA-like protein
MTTAIADDTRQAIKEEWSLFDRVARAPRFRTMREFAEEEIVLPNGPYRGMRFNGDRQPFAGLFLDAVDSGLWNRFAAVGPTQSGKTLVCYVIPILYHLFEMKETVICGVPDMNVAADKWREDIKPVIDASRYSDQIRKTGKGSRGGEFISIQFTDGQTLRFMSGSARDQARAAYTARVVAITEVDKFAAASEGSEETDKVTQLEARTDAFDLDCRIYMECTATIEEGRIWEEYDAGTKSQIVVQCPYCREWVTPERDHFKGWQEAESDVEAGEKARFYCPACATALTADDRRLMNAPGRLLHKGQAISKRGRVTGDLPKTRTLGFRWGAFNNLFASTEKIAAREFKASRREDEELGERELCQYVWAQPYKPPELAMTPLDWKKLAKRTEQLAKGVMPQEHEHLAVGIDPGEHQSHWAAVSCDAQMTPHVVEYGVLDVPSRDMDIEAALTGTLLQFLSVCAAGWRHGPSDLVVPGQVWIDAGHQWKTEVIYKLYRRVGSPVMPTKGRGAGETSDGPHVSRTEYRTPKRLTREIREIGHHYHISLLPKRTHLCHVNADYWVNWVHTRLALPRDAPGAMTFFAAPWNEHWSFTKQLTAQVLERKFVPEKGLVYYWNMKRVNNHWLDAVALACAGLHRAAAAKTKQAPAEWFKREK